MSGKGSAPRPFSVPREIYDLRFDIAFGSMSQAERDKKKALLEEMEWELANNNQGEWKPVEWGK